MKMFKFMVATSMLSAMLCLGLTACSDDNGNENNGDDKKTNTPVTPSKVFEGGVPKSAAGMSISTNEEGLVTSISTEDGTKAVFEYFGAETRAEVAMSRARITVTDEDGDVTELNLQLNSDGYVAYCNSIDHAGTSEASNFTWEMKYDADGHLIEMRRSESDGELTKITYKDGDVVATSTQYNLNGGEDVNGDGIINDQDIITNPDTEIYYTTDEITTPIENKGCLMMFDELLDVDMDEMIYAYYGGMLGTATKHLPLKQHSYGGTMGYDDFEFKWTLNSNGYPTELVIKSPWENPWGDDKYPFNW